MIWFAANDYLVQAKWFGSRQMIIWFKPNDLVRAKWLFGSSQMIWRARINYFKLKYIFEIYMSLKKLHIQSIKHRNENSHTS